MNRSKWIRSVAVDKLLIYIPMGIVVYLVLPPLILLLISTFKSTGDRLPIEPGPWTLENIIYVFSSADTYLLFKTSLIYAFGNVGLALIIAIVLVWLIERTDLPGSNLVFSLVMLPIAIPGIVKAIGWAFLASPHMGALNVFLRWLFDLSGRQGPLNIYSLSGIIFVSCLSHVPSITLMIAGAFRSFDPALEEASELSGATRLQTQRFISMPLLRPALLGAFIYYFVLGLENFQIPAILGLNAGIHVFSTRIYLATHPVSGLPNFGLASGYSMLLFLVAVLLIFIYRRLVQRSESFAVITGKGYRPRRSSLGKWKYVVFAGVGLYVLLAAVLPLLMLLWVSLQPFFATPSVKALARMSLVNYNELFEMGQFRRAVLNTLFLAPVVATATMLLSTLISWMRVRGKFWGRSIPDFLTFINISIPAVVFGLAIIFVYLSIPPLRPVYGTIWILMIAYITRYLTFSTRLMGGAVIQIHQELEEASETSGATRWQTFFRIIIPLLFPSFLNGWLWVSVHSLREATLAVMLMTPANVVIASLIWSRWVAGGDYGTVAAMSIIIVVPTVLLTVVSRWVFGRNLNTN